MRRVATLAAALSLGMTIAGLVLGLRFSPGFSKFLGIVPVGASFAVTGWVIASRRPGHVVGRLLLAIGTAFSAQVLTQAYGTAGVQPEHGWPAATYVLHLGDFIWAPCLGLLVLLVLYFPDGRLLSKRWRVVAGAAIAFVPLVVAVFLFDASNVIDVEGVGPITTPFARDSLTWLNDLAPLTFLLQYAAFAGAVAAVVRRFRQSSGALRQQMKWFVATAPLLPLTYLSYLIDFGLFLALSSVCIPAVSVAIAVSVLRYRLYDIDRLVSRTVSYAVLTALLALPYLGVVALTSNLAGGAGDLGVALATLAAAAAFNPLRRRVQARVDRRFNRGRYDAQRTIDAFSARLRNDVDLESLRADLLAVVTSTMQPVQSSLWLRSQS